MPGLQENGQFIGEERYRQMLLMQNPPLSPGEFEEQVRRGVTLEKLQAALTDWITLTDKELEDEFKSRNEKVKLAVVSFPADKFRDGLQATDAELSAYLRRAQGRFEDSREAQSQICAGRHAGHSRAHPGFAAGHPAQVRGQPAAVLDPRAGARQPHPPEDRGQGRRRGQEAGGRAAGESEGRGRFRAARHEILGGRRQQGQGGAISTSFRRARWCRSSTRSHSR